jgi:lipoprotein-anchoring transpeptidase ErfK/SrfK
MKFLGVLLIGLLAGSMLTARESRATKGRSPAKKVVWDVAVVNDPNQPVPAEERGAGILRTQIMLSKAGFSPAAIDGEAGDNLRRAVAGFQQSRGFIATGELDEPTWKALNEDPSPATTVYIVTAEDSGAEYVELPRDMMEQSKLKSLGYESATEKIAEQFHMTPGLLRNLNPGKDLEKAGEQLNVLHITRPPIAEMAAALIVTESSSTVTAIDGAGDVIRQYVASMGSDKDPLPVGDWEVTGIVRKPKFHYNPELFWDADPSHSKATLPAGPNSPVGLVWIDLSKEHYGIHGTPNPATVGHRESHGCIRLPNWDALELAALVEKGTLVLMRKE